VIFDTQLADDEINSQIEKCKNFLEQQGVKILTVVNWGRRRLAFPIKHRRDGYYIIYYFTLDSNLKILKEIEKRYQINEAVLRHLIIKLEPKAVEIVLKDFLPSEKKVEEPVKEQPKDISKTTEKVEVKEVKLEEPEKKLEEESKNK